MARVITIILLVLLALGAAYLAFFHIPENARIDEGPLPVATTTASSAVLESDSDEYEIRIAYPQFGIPEFDEGIRTSVESLANEVRSQAEKDTPVKNGFRKYELVGQYDRAMVSGGIASARLVAGEDFGGAHPLPIVMTFNYDIQKNAPLTLDDALALIGKTLAEVSSDAKVQLDAKLGDDVIAPEGADPKPENYQTFLVDAESVTFIFQPYQVAPYAAGAPEVVFLRR